MTAAIGDGGEVERWVGVVGDDGGGERMGIVCCLLMTPKFERRHLPTLDLGVIDSVPLNSGSIPSG